MGFFNSFQDDEKEIHLKFNDDVAKKIAALKVNTDTATTVEIIRKALAVYECCVLARFDDCEIAIIPKDLAPGYKIIDIK